LEKSEEYLKEIRQSDGLAHAVLKKITIEGKKITFSLVTDLTYSEADTRHARDVSQKYVPIGYTAEATVLKSVPDADGMSREIARIIKNRFPSVAAFISPSDISVEVGKGTGPPFLRRLVRRIYRYRKRGG